MADDLFQEGCIGLMRAAELFNPLLGVRFSTYAFGWIRQKVGSALRRGGVIALPHTRHAECVRGVVSIHSLWEEDGFRRGRARAGGGGGGGGRGGPRRSVPTFAFPP